MNPFKKEKISGLPAGQEKNIYDRTPEQKRVIRPLKKEFGSDHMVAILNEKIDSGKNIGEYKEDKISEDIRNLEEKRKFLLSNNDIFNCYNNIKELFLIQAEISDLENEIKSVLLNDNGDDSYNEKINILNQKEGEISSISNSINKSGEDTIKKAGEVIKIDNQIQKLKEIHKKTFGNQDIKSEQGQYLN